MAPFFLVWSFFLLYKIINQKNTAGYWLPVVSSGLLFGFGFHSYIAYRIAPLLLIFPFYELWKNGRKKIIIIFLAAVFLAGLPLGIYFLQNPADFMGRTTQVSVFSGPSPVKDIAINAAKTIGMLFYKGDYNWRHNLAGEAELWWPIGLLFLTGLLLGLSRIFNYKSKISNQFLIPKFSIYFLSSWLIIMSLPVIISSEGIPHALRSIILIPPIMILAGIGLEFICGKMEKLIEKAKERYPESKKQLTRIKKESAIFLFFIFTAIMANSFNQYFQKWAVNPRTSDAFAGRYYNIGKTLDQMDNGIKKYVIINAKGINVRDLPMPSQTVMFLTDTFTEKRRAEKNIVYVLPDDAENIACPEKCAVAALETDHQIYQTIKNKNPNLKISIENGAVEILKQ